MLGVEVRCASSKNFQERRHETMNWIEADWACSAMPVRDPGANKGDNGWIVVVAGSDPMPGAAVLTALGSYCSGAGRVTVASTPRVLTAISYHVPEALQLSLVEHSDLNIQESAWLVDRALESAAAAIFGPGLGQSNPTGRFLSAVWERLNKASVIDADALNHIALGIAPPTVPCVYTPHPGECSRLVGESIEAVQSDRVAHAVAASKKLGGTVVLKGMASVVADLDGRIASNPTGNPGMATAGMGDVLSGVVGTLLAQGLERFEAACLAVYWHGLAGDIAAERIGQVGYTASDVARFLPEARDSILNGERKGGSVRP